MSGTRTMAHHPTPTWLRWAWVGVAAAVLGVVLVTPTEGHWYAGIEGDFCRNRRPSECCDGRYDDCSVPILGTLCYCDQFCNRTYNPDCCPDFWDVCLGIRPPRPPAPIIDPSCSREGVTIPSGGSHTFNCNACKCVLGQLTCEEDECLVDEEDIASINQRSQQYGWRAVRYEQHWGRKLSQGLTYRTGTINPEALVRRMYPILLRPDPARITRTFDAAQKPEWQGKISPARDQGWCGASWAFSTLGVAQDRLSIESLGNETVRLAPQHLLSCDRRGQKGCEGGHIDRAWQYLRKIGVVNEECYQYESGSGSLPACRIPRRANLFSLRCAATQVNYQRRDLYKTEPAYRISGKEQDIMWEILSNGPVQAVMKVYPDLFHYAGGVYRHTGPPDDQFAYHSVRITGWGEDRTATGPVKFWTVANSWGETWGENGFFRIRRGNNECDIESFIVAVRARLAYYERQRGGDGARNLRHTKHHTQGHHHHGHHDKQDSLMRYFSLNEV